MEYTSICVLYKSREPETCDILTFFQTTGNCQNSKIDKNL